MSESEYEYLEDYKNASAEQKISIVGIEWIRWLALAKGYAQIAKHQLKSGDSANLSDIDTALTNILEAVTKMEKLREFLLD